MASEVGRGATEGVCRIGARRGASSAPAGCRTGRFRRERRIWRLPFSPSRECARRGWGVGAADCPPAQLHGGRLKKAARRPTTPSNSRRRPVGRVLPNAALKNARPLMGVGDAAHSGPETATSRCYRCQRRAQRGQTPGSQRAHTEVALQLRQI